MKYKHLTLCQRSQIQLLVSMEYSQKNIAEKIGVNPSTMSRELKRNTVLCKYRHRQAHRIATERRSNASSKAKKMTTAIVDFIDEKLAQEQWSPVQISGVLAANDCNISHTSIYKHVWHDRRQGGMLYKHLRHQGKKYNYKSGKKAGRGRIPNRVDISQRSAVVERKSRIGDWEADTIIGKQHQGAIVSLVDRKSKFTLLSLIANTTADVVKRNICKLLSSIADLPVHTITYDNGKEFSGHEEIAKVLSVKCYFATPYHSWERGLNEHTNGLVRQYLPKKTDFLELETKTVIDIQNKLNNRPRKVLGFRTPWEVLQGKRRPQKIALHG